VALMNFESIANQADGIVFSRGNLGLEVAPEKMALVQKSAISRCNILGKPVILTRLVDTMASAPRPTRWVVEAVVWLPSYTLHHHMRLIIHQASQSSEAPESRPCVMPFSINVVCAPAKHGSTFMSRPSLGNCGRVSICPMRGIGL
jgi:Pyruvate kinase, barrel domain